MDNLIILNPKKCDDTIFPESLSNTSLYNTCSICKIDKQYHEFHSLDYKIQDKIIKQEYLFNYPCKTCMPYEYFRWTKKKNGPYPDFNKLQEDYLNRTQLEYEQKHNLILLKKSDAMTFLNIEHKSHFDSYHQDGFIQEIKFNIPINLFYQGKTKRLITYQCYYILSELELIKYHRQNGHYYFPGKKFVYEYKKEQLKVNWPYILIGKNNKPIFFVNMTDKKKPCGKCLEVKNLDDFYPENKMKCGRKTSCKTCDKASNLKHYNSLTAAQKKEYYLKIKEWKKINKIKYKHKKKPESRIKKQIRHRLKEYIDRFFKENYSNDNVGVWKLKWTSCTAKELKEHLESLFQDGMSWDNYGPGYKLNENGKVIYDENGNTIPLKQWHVDHILPVSKFDLTNPEAIKHINHYKNLRPEWSNENLLKSNKIIGELINNPQIKEIYDKYIQLCHKPKDVLNVN